MSITCFLDGESVEMNFVCMHTYVLSVYRESCQILIVFCITGTSCKTVQCFLVVMCTDAEYYCLCGALKLLLLLLLIMQNNYFANKRKRLTDVFGDFFELSQTRVEVALEESFFLRLQRLTEFAQSSQNLRLLLTGDV